MCFSQGFSLRGTSTAFVGSATLTMAGGTYTSGNTYVFFVNTTRSGGGVPSDNPTVSSGSLTLVKRATVTGSNNRIICYTAVCGSTTTTSITFTYAETQAVHFYAYYEGTSLSGFTVISTATGGATGTNPSITLPSSKLSCTIGYFFNGNSSAFGGTPESGWTEDFDNGIVNASEAGYHRDSTTDNTVDVTAASSTWTGIAIQFSTKRRIFNCQ
jgi:hypothetical protein